MPTPVYADVLTRESAARLSALVRGLPHPVALTPVPEHGREALTDRFAASETPTARYSARRAVNI